MNVNIALLTVTDTRTLDTDKSGNILDDLLKGCPPVISSLLKQLAYRLSQCDKEIESLKKKIN